MPSFASLCEVDHPAPRFPRARSSDLLTSRTDCAGPRSDQYKRRSDLAASVVNHPWTRR